MLIKKCSLNTIRILESHRQSEEHKKRLLYFFLQENRIRTRKSMGESCYRPLFLNIAVSPVCTTQWLNIVQSNWNLFLRNRIIFFSLVVCASHRELYNNPDKTGVGIWRLRKQPDPRLQVAIYESKFYSEEVLLCTEKVNNSSWFWCNLTFIFLDTLKWPPTWVPRRNKEKNMWCKQVRSYYYFLLCRAMFLQPFIAARLMICKPD